MSEVEYVANEPVASGSLTTSPTYRPLRDLVLVHARVAGLEHEIVGPNGQKLSLIIPATERVDSSVARVVAVGPEVRNVLVGDEVLYDASLAVALDDKGLKIGRSNLGNSSSGATRLLVRESDLIAVLESEGSDSEVRP